jgi:hypothetical protein
MKDYTFIFSGASISQTPWPCWKDFIVTRYGLKNIVDNAYRGVGNEFMVESTIHHCNKASNPYVMIMFTMFDKWDWFVEDPILAKKINQEQRHPLRDLDGEQSTSGYWSTGSWFPEYKEHYLENYYSEKYFLSQTLKNLYVLQQYLKTNSIPNLILFDSPILECTEQGLNTGQITRQELVKDNPLAQIWYNQIDWSNIYKPGLIGFCEGNNLEWFGKKAKVHPPSISQLEFCKQKIWPQLDQEFTIKEPDQDTVAKKFQGLFYE